MPYNILIMGASYGSLLASKLLFGGHKVTPGLPAGRGGPDQCRRVPGAPADQGPEGPDRDRIRASCRARSRPPVRGTSNPKDYDLVGLAMQEPQYRSPGVRELLDAVAKSRVPCMSIMNMPPLPYVKRIPGLNYDALKNAYTDASRLGQFRSRHADLVQP